MSVLPTELVEKCISHIDPDDKATCLAASRTSAACHRAATPLLYRELSTSRDVARRGIGGYDGRFGSSASLQLLCRTLVLKPELARFPESLSHDLHPRAVDPETRRSLYRENRLWNVLHLRGKLDLEVCRALKARAEAEEEETLLEDEPWLLVLFALCPNVRALNLCGQPNLLQRIPLLQMLLQFEGLRSQTNIGQNPHLLWIEHVSLDNSAIPDAHLTAADLASMLLLPRIRSLSMSSFTRSSQISEVRGPVSTLQSLRVRNCDGRTEDLEILLPRCGNLKHLDIEYKNREDMHGSMGWSSFGTILRATCSQLESLRLDSWPRWARDMPEDVAWALRSEEEKQDTPTDASANLRLGGLGDLRCMSGLRTLTVSKNALRDDLAFALLGQAGDRAAPPPLSQVLPPSLRELTIVHPDDSVLDGDPIIVDPFVASLAECVVLNSKKTRWWSKTGGHGSVFEANELQSGQASHEPRC